MRILAIDFGMERMGIAVSDELKMLAHPLEMIPANPFQAFLTRLNHLIVEKDVELLLVGMPRNMNGSYGPAAERVREFVFTLQSAVAVPIKTWDERLTSVEAHRVLSQANASRQQRKSKVDQTAAAIFLQSYLDHLAAH